MAPVRPTAVAAPTPLARTAPGYTLAASAYIVVWIALMRPPVIVNITMIGASGASTEIVIALKTRAPRIAPAFMVSIAARDPMRDMIAPLANAPATPPRLNAVMPLLATPASKPALASTVGNQEKPW